jgi:hypothetical protein
MHPRNKIMLRASCAVAPLGARQGNFKRGFVGFVGLRLRAGAVELIFVMVFVP